MEQRVSLITLGVQDLARARAFYEALGWSSGAAPADDVVFFQTGGMIVGLWGRDSLTQDSGVEDLGGYGGVTLAYNARSPAEVDATIEQARAGGARIAREPGETFWGGYAAVFVDPDGHPWEVAQPQPEPEGRRAGQRSLAGRLASLRSISFRAAKVNCVEPPAGGSTSSKPAASYSPRPFRAKYHRR